MTFKSAGKARAPISSHPVFPAIVALWFAALLGLGSLVLPVALFEQLIAITGTASLVPAAQPPLGVTARILISLAAAGLGVLAGLAVARRVVMAQSASQQELQRERSPQAAAPASAKRPISATEELGISRLDDSNAAEAPRRAPIPGRRRPLSLASDDGPSDFFESAPLPGEAELSDSPESVADELDLAAFPEPEPESEDSHPFGTGSLSGLPVSSALPMGYAPYRRDQQAAKERMDAAASAADERQSGDPLPPHGPEAEEPRMPDFATPPEPLVAYPAAARTFGAQTGETAEEGAAASEPRERASDDLGGRPLHKLGTVELVERFALSLQRRAAAADDALELPRLRSQPAAPAFETAPVPAAEEPAAAEDFAFLALTEATSPALPAALRPITFDDDEANEAEPEPLGAFALSLDPRARPFARYGAPDAEAQAAADAEDQDPGYSSLLAMKRPLAAGREFVRIDDETETEALEPVVVFPGQYRPAAPASDGPSREPVSHLPLQKGGTRPFDGPAGGPRAARSDFPAPAMPAVPAARNRDPGATERALREALEKLQKLSGAA